MVRVYDTGEGITGGDVDVSPRARVRRLTGAGIDGTREAKRVRRRCDVAIHWERVRTHWPGA